jgi:GNAT superfamily N-acetyltransferase
MSLAAWREAAIDRRHDRKAFDCGEADLNSFLMQYARQAHENGASKTYVALDAADQRTIFGYYTLSPAHVEFHRVPDIARVGGGRHPVGGFRLARLAVGKAWQGQGLGGQLLVAAARRCIRASAEIGGTALLIDAKNAEVAAWYRLYGAVPLLDSPLSLLLPYEMMRAALRAAGKTEF